MTSRLRYLADFGSASAMRRALAAFLHGETPGTSADPGRCPMPEPLRFDQLEGLLRNAGERFGVSVRG